MSASKLRLVFCHGLPGSVDDADLLRHGTAIELDDLVVLDLCAFDPDKSSPMAQALAAFDQAMEGSGQTAHLVGFSIGAMFALVIAAERADMVSKLTLISPAAPLELGAFLPKMAGRTVFTLAKDHAVRFQMLTWAQGLLTRCAPLFVARQMFANCREKSLLQEDAFKALLYSGFRNSFVANPKSYMSIIKTYTGQWGQTLGHVTCKTDIVHGAEDIWAPVDMAYALQAEILGETTVTIIPNAEHYTTLKQWDHPSNAHL